MTELILNLWATYNAETGFVYALCGKVYMASGNDDEKLALLRMLAPTDHLTAKKYKVPDRFSVNIGFGRIQKNTTVLNSISDPNAQLFEELFKSLENELPLLSVINGDDVKQIKQRLPDNPFCVITTLYEDKNGNITPIITDEDRAWIQEQERLRGRY